MEFYCEQFCDSKFTTFLTGHASREANIINQCGIVRLAMHCLPLLN